MQAGQARGVVQQGGGCLANGGRGIAERAAGGERGTQRGGHVPGDGFLRTEFRQIAGAGRGQVDQ